MSLQLIFLMIQKILYNSLTRTDHCNFQLSENILFEKDKHSRFLDISENVQESLSPTIVF